MFAALSVRVQQVLNVKKVQRCVRPPTPSNQMLQSNWCICPPPYHVTLKLVCKNGKRMWHCLLYLLLWNYSYLFFNFIFSLFSFFNEHFLISSLCFKYFPFLHETFNWLVKQVTEKIIHLKTTCVMCFPWSAAVFWLNLKVC